MTRPQSLKSTKAVARTLLTAFIFPWVFDVRSAAGLEWLIYVQLLSFLSSTIVLVVSLRIFRNRVDLGPFAGNALSIAVCVIFIFVSTISGIYGHNDTFLVFSHAIPIILFIYALLLISLMAQAGLKPEDVFDVVIYTAVAAILIRIPIVTFLFGINFSTVRYQILCGATTVGSAYILSRLPAGLRRNDIVFALSQITIILLSVTRGEILVVGGMAGALMLSMARRLLRPRMMLSFGLAVTLFIASIYVLGAALPGNPLRRWTQRTTSFQTGGEDASALDRESQMLFQLEQFSVAGIEKYVGFGIAAPGGNDPSIEAYMESRVSPSIYVPTGFADETYISLIFLGGLLGGGPLLLMQFLWLWNSFRAIPFVLKTFPKKAAWLTMAPLAVIGYQISNFLAASFGDRSQSIFFGLCLGMTGWLTAMRRRQARTKVRAGTTIAAAWQVSR